MANLDAVVKELKQERDRLDKAIAALTLLDRKSGRSGTRTMSAQRGGELLPLSARGGLGKGRLHNVRRVLSGQAAHLCRRYSRDRMHHRGRDAGESAKQLLKTTETTSQV